MEKMTGFVPRLKSACPKFTRLRMGNTP
jgi:hypothetical protein